MAPIVTDFSAFPAVGGVRLAAAAAGIRRNAGADLALVELVPGSATAAVFTRNAFCAAPVTVAREHLAAAAPRAWLVNAGNANAGTGAAGLAAARESCAAAAAALGCRVEEVLPFSTGVIGEDLPVDRLAAAIPGLAASLSPGGWAAAAEAIRTTDTVAKGAWRSLELDGGTVTVAGIAKGSGMIRPDMATMLAFLATDAAVPAADLQAMLRRAVDASFNRITVDGDTSTNDACVLAATGAAGIHPRGGDLERLERAVAEVCRDLALRIVADGEGATRLVTVVVEGGRDEAECEAVAFTIAHSPLVKTAVFAGDPNWGRILAAVGRAGLGDLDVEQVEIFLDDVCVARGGGRAPGYREADGAAVMARDAFTIRVVLGRGSASATVWTCDLSYDYVRINAEYRT